ncbi:MAG: HEPN domain-containing protein [Planctomycetes bacterium]|nr:HEPN domain-containing protein [Planctomycetota bacterium]
MKPSVRGWIRKAEGDYRVAMRESNVNLDPCPEAVCFHAQQCVEKYFKAVLVEHGQPVPKTHDLVLLWRILAPVGTHLRRRPKGLALLSVGAVEYRYAGRRATLAAGRQAVETLTRVRALARSAPGLT